MFYVWRFTKKSKHFRKISLTSSRKTSTVSMKPDSRVNSLAFVRGSLQNKRHEDATITSQTDTMIVHDTPIIRGGVNDAS